MQLSELNNENKSSHNAMKACQSSPAGCKTLNVERRMALKFGDLHSG